MKLAIVLLASLSVAYAVPFSCQITKDYGNAAKTMASDVGNMANTFIKGLVSGPVDEIQNILGGHHRHPPTTSIVMEPPPRYVLPPRPVPPQYYLPQVSPVPPQYVEVQPPQYRVQPPPQFDMQPPPQYVLQQVPPQQSTEPPQNSENQ